MLRIAADRPEQQVGLDRVVAVEMDDAGCRPCRFSIFSNGALNLKSIPLVSEIWQQPVADLLVIMAQDAVAAIDQGHVAGEFVEDAGEFVGDIAAAGDHRPLRNLRRDGTPRSR